MAKKKLNLDDIRELDESDTSGYLGDGLEKEWNKEIPASIIKGKNCPNPSLAKALVRQFFWQNVLLGFMNFLDVAVLEVCQPIFMGWVINYFTSAGKSTHQNTVLGYAGLFIMSKVISTFVDESYERYAMIVGMRARVACCSLLYRKMLRLEKITSERTASGQIVNLMSNDVNRFEELFNYLHYIWVTPIQIGVIAYLMWDAIGIMEIVGMGVLLMLSFPFVAVVAWAGGKLREQIAKRTDARVQFMSELVSGMQAIKMYAWEKPFQNIIKKLRLTEMRKVRHAMHLHSVFQSSFCFVERTSLFATLVLYVLSGGKLTADVAFTLATFFNNLQVTASIAFPMGIMSLSEARVSVRRIQQFLLLEEKSTRNYKSLLKSDDLKFNQVSASWIKTQVPQTLTNISFTLKSGNLCGVIGPVGSGKTAVLNVILQELRMTSGSISLPKNISTSYASQEAWLFKGSIRENILFGRSFDAKRYKEVTEVCALDDDFNQLAFGDATEVGERGSMLSGGQKARVNLARAVYEDADLYLLDDPLSAVDPKVARHLFEKCIVGFLRGKTRMLVTHQLQFIREVDMVLCLDQGSLRYSGNPAIVKDVELDLESENKTLTSAKSTVATADNSTQNFDASCPIDFVDDLEDSTQVANWNLLKTYFTYGVSSCYLAALLMMIILAQVFISGSDYWVGYWANVEDQRMAYPNRTYESFLVEWHVLDKYGLMKENCLIYVYTLLIVLCIIFSVVEHLMFSVLVTRASKRLHDSMFSNLLDSKMAFFQANPSGRILNRFSKDMGAVDEILPRHMIQGFQIYSALVGILLVIICVYPLMTLPILMIVIIFYYSNKIYIRTIQALRNLEAAAKSPVFSHAKASLDGLITIRSSGLDSETRLIAEFDRLQDVHSGASFLIIGTSYTVGLFVDLVILAFTTIITLAAIFMRSDTLFGGNIGLALSQSAILSSLLQYGLRLFGEFMAQMTSVSRVLEYTNLPKEFPLEVEESLPQNWPDEGRIQFRNLSMKYKQDSPMILQNFNLTVEGGWKVGIVGRTGAGKSSIISALFRLYTDNLDGEISIDGLDTSALGLRDLRSKISIIPQDPVLFSQTIRYNLDPFSQKEDSVLLDALKDVELEHLALDQLITEKGCNFSVGQRQLICLARAIVQNNKILVLDEATANIDDQTDSIIQDSIRLKFDRCTVLTIAHRLNTVIDSDRIVVMDKGQIVEFGRPHELLANNSNGHLSRMVNQSGIEGANRLRNLAWEKEKRHSDKEA